MTPDSKLRSAVIPAGLFQLTESLRPTRQINQRDTRRWCAAMTRHSEPLFCNVMAVVTILCFRQYKYAVNFIRRMEDCYDISFKPLDLKRCGCNLKLIIIKRRSKLDIMSISNQIALSWMHQDGFDDWSAMVQRIILLGAVRQQAIIWNKVDQWLRRHMVPVGHNEYISHLTILWDRQLNSAFNRNYIVLYILLCS